MNIIDRHLKFTSALSKRRRTDYIVIHHPEAVTASVEQIHQWHVGNGWAGIGYNLYIRKDGSVYAGRGVEYVGAHAQGYNSRSVGVCCEGDYHRKDKSMPAAQYAALVDVVRWLKQKYPDAAVVGHRELMSTNCPGQYFPLDKLKGDLMMKNFEDMAGHWAKQHVEDLHEMGVVNGDGGKFRPDDAITRAECATMVRNAVRYVTGK